MVNPRDVAGNAEEEEHVEDALILVVNKSVTGRVPFYDTKGWHLQPGSRQAFGSKYSKQLSSEEDGWEEEGGEVRSGVKVGPSVYYFVFVYQYQLWRTWQLGLWTGWLRLKEIYVQQKLASAVADRNWCRWKKRKGVEGRKGICRGRGGEGVLVVGVGEVGGGRIWKYNRCRDRQCSFNPFSAYRPSADILQKVLSQCLWAVHWWLVSFSNFPLLLFRAMDTERGWMVSCTCPKYKNNM